MAIIYNPETQSYEWDYAAGPMPNDVEPFDPATGLPLPAPPGAYGNAATWDGRNGSWSNGDGPASSGVTGEPEPTIVTPTPPTGPGTPTTTPSTPSSGGSLASLLDPYRGQFQAPDVNAAVRDAVGRLPQLPGFQAPDLPTFEPYAAGDPFSFEDYQAPTFDQMLSSDPGFSGRVKRGEQAILNNKAAQGLVRLPATLKGLLDYNQDIASSEFGNFNNRKLVEYGVRRNNALENYNTNEGNRYKAYTTNVGNKFGLFDRDLQGRQAAYAPKVLKYTTEAGVGERAGMDALKRAQDMFKMDYDLWADQRDSVFDKLKWQSEFGLDSATR